MFSCSCLIFFIVLSIFVALFSRFCFSLLFFFFFLFYYTKSCLKFTFNKFPFTIPLWRTLSWSNSRSVVVSFVVSIHSKDCFAPSFVFFALVFLLCYCFFCFCSVFFCSQKLYKVSHSKCQMTCNFNVGNVLLILISKKWAKSLKKGREERRFKTIK